MNEEWLVDGRKIPDEVMGYIRKIAVQALRENGQSPEVVVKVLNFNRSCIYEWLKRYDEAFGPDVGAGWKHARGSGGHAERRLQCPLNCHTQGRDELFGDRRRGEFGAVYRVFRRPDPRTRASLDFNRRPGPVSWLSEGTGMGSSASESAQNLLFAQPLSGIESR